MKLFLSIFLLFILSSCQNPTSDSSLPDRELIFSKDFSRVDIYNNNVEFNNEQAKELYDESINFVKAKDFKKAKEKLLAAYDLEPDNPSVLINLGNLANKKADYELAISYFKKVDRNNDSPNERTSKFNLGDTYYAMGEYQKSINTLQEFLSNSKDSIMRASSYYILGRSYAELKLCDSSRSSLEEFKRLTRSNSHFRVMTDHLEFKARNCGQNNFAQNLVINSGNTKYDIGALTYSVIDSLGNTTDSTALFSRVTDLKLLVNSKPVVKRIAKKDFQDFLYRDFYAEAYIVSTEVVTVLDREIIMNSTLKSVRSDKQCFIMYSIKTDRSGFEDIVLGRVEYQ